ncbi:hypothetical protein OY671_009462, partial [Metschnikowia pulcherrima]
QPHRSAFPPLRPGPAKRPAGRAAERGILLQDLHSAESASVRTVHPPRGRVRHRPGAARPGPLRSPRTPRRRAGYRRRAGGPRGRRSGPCGGRQGPAGGSRHAPVSPLAAGRGGPHPHHRARLLRRQLRDRRGRDRHRRFAAAAVEAARRAGGDRDRRIRAAHAVRQQRSSRRDAGGCGTDLYRALRRGAGRGRPVRDRRGHRLCGGFR